MEHYYRESFYTCQHTVNSHKKITIFFNQKWKRHVVHCEEDTCLFFLSSHIVSRVSHFFSHLLCLTTYISFFFFVSVTTTCFPLSQPHFVHFFLCGSECIVSSTTISTTTVSSTTLRKDLFLFLYVWESKNASSAQSSSQTVLHLF